MRSRILLTVIVASLGVAGIGATVTGPPRERSLVVPGRVLALGLTGRHVALAVGATRTQCPQVRLWLTESNVRLRYPWRLGGCKEGPSTGFGVPSVAVARTRLVWLSYIGGNLRDWQLWTATPTRRTARQLRFVERDVDAPAPIVLGPGTPEGIPYAVDREVTYLGDEGRAIFKTMLDAPVRAVAGGRGPKGVRVAALLGDSVVVGLDRDGQQVISWQYTGRVLTAVRVSWRGLVVQAGNDAYVRGTRIPLPAGATLVDVAQGRILWERHGDLGATTIASGRSQALVDGSPARPVRGQLEANGLAWTRGRSVRWSPGPPR
jgi:hypothetical protein